MDLNSYFSRVNYPEPSEPSLKHLSALHRAHVLQVPFENLDIHYPQRIVLESNRFFDKIVTNKRGGFCYEQNGLLYEVLQQLGYDTWLISASVYQADQDIFGPPSAHVAIMVELDGQRWLVDVGFGSSFPEPLLLANNQPQEQDGVLYTIRSSYDETFVLDRSYDGGKSFTPMYQFDLQPRRLDYFCEMCDFHQSSEKSPLYRKKLISIARPGGRITLTSDQLIITQAGEREVTELKDEEDFQEKLRQYFGFSIMKGKVQGKLHHSQTNTHP